MYKDLDVLEADTIKHLKMKEKHKSTLEALEIVSKPENTAEISSMW